MRPRLENASAAWGSSCTRSDALYLERVQNSIARTIARPSNSTEDVPVRSSAALKHLGGPPWLGEGDGLVYASCGSCYMARAHPNCHAAFHAQQMPDVITNCTERSLWSFPSALRPDTGTLSCRTQMLSTVPCLLVLCLRLVSLLFFSLLIVTLHTISIASVFRSLLSLSCSSGCLWLPPLVVFS